MPPSRIFRITGAGHDGRQDVNDQSDSVDYVSRLAPTALRRPNIPNLAKEQPAHEYPQRMDFWQQLGTTIVGAFAGAGAALVTGFWVRTNEAKAKERAALNGLLLDLQLKRAFAPTTPQCVNAAAETVDYKQCRDSVYDSRKLIRDVRLQLRPKSKAFDHLASMSAACNTYLHSARVQPDTYQFLLEALSASLDEQAKKLGVLKSVEYRRPGSFAYSSPNSQLPASE